MKYKKNKMKIKNVFSILLATAITGSCPVVAMPPPNPTQSTSDPKSTSRIVVKSSDSTKTITTTSKAKTSTMLLQNTDQISLSTLSTISQRPTIPFSITGTTIQVPVALKDSNLCVMIYCLSKQQYNIDSLMHYTSPPKNISIPWGKLDYRNKYQIIISAPYKKGTKQYSGIYHKLLPPADTTAKALPPVTSTTTTHTLPSKSDAKKSSEELAVTSTSKATGTLTTQSKPITYEIMGTVSLSPIEILKQQDTLKKQNIQQCLHAYNMWHGGKIAIALQKPYDLVDKSHSDYIKNVATFQKIERILEIIKHIKQPDVIEKQALIGQTIENSIEDEDDKSNLKKMLELMVKKKSAITTSATAKSAVPASTTKATIIV